MQQRWNVQRTGNYRQRPNAKARRWFWRKFTQQGGWIFELHGYHVRFNNEAVNEILKEAPAEDAAVTAVCNEISRDYDYDFKPVVDRSGQSRFTLHQNAVLPPDTYLEELIRESYRHPPALLG